MNYLERRGNTLCPPSGLRKPPRTWGNTLNSPPGLWKTSRTWGNILCPPALIWGEQTGAQLAPTRSAYLWEPRRPVGKIPTLPRLDLPLSLGVGIFFGSRGNFLRAPLGLGTLPGSIEIPLFFSKPKGHSTMLPTPRGEILAHTETPSRLSPLRCSTPELLEYFWHSWVRLLNSLRCHQDPAP